MRRILQAWAPRSSTWATTASVDEVVTAALQEDAQGIAISSYQGGHVEYFKSTWWTCSRARGAATSRSSAAVAA